MVKKNYNGKETEKAVDNFPITNSKVSLSIIKALVNIKIASAMTNHSLGNLSVDIYNAILKASEEIISGSFDNQFVTDTVQGGAGTSINMNVNEVISARATEISRGKVNVDPISNVNLTQSTNDVLPTSLRLVILQEIDSYIAVLNDLKKAFIDKSQEFKGIIKVGRTHLQDAVPIALSQEFIAYSSFIARDIKRLVEVKKYLLLTNLGGTAVGTGINSSEKYIKLVNINLSKITGYKFKPAKDLVDATQNIDVFLHVSYLLGVSAAGLSKICNDLRLMASGPRAGLGEITLKELQNGSSIMPGKSNPVIFETINQIANLIIGSTVSNSVATISGQLELNVMLPTFIKTLTDSFQMLDNGIKKLTESVKLIEVNEERCKELLDKSLSFATILNKYIGYVETAKIVKSALKNNTSLIEEVEKSGIIKEEKLKEIFSIDNLIHPSKN